MYKVIKNNQKKLLAIFAAALMVVFILPTRNSGAPDRDNLVIGTIDGKSVTASDYEAAAQQWKMLSGIPIMVGDPREQNVQSLPAVYFQTAGSIARDIARHPDMFFLLLKEADARGIVVPPERVSGLMADRNLAPIISTLDPRTLRPALESLMRIRKLLDTAGDAVKISEPEIRHRIAEGQQTKLNLVDFDVDALKATVPAPTDAEMKEFFDKYAKTPSGAPATRPGDLSFGYRYPDRVKLQYLSIPKDEIRKVVLDRAQAEPNAGTTGLPEASWEVRARQYYLKHQSEFVSFPSLEPTSAPTTTTAPTTVPTTEPTKETAAPADVKPEAKSDAGTANPQAAETPAPAKCDGSAPVTLVADPAPAPDAKPADVKTPEAKLEETKPAESKPEDAKTPAATTAPEKPPTSAPTTTTAPSTRPIPVMRPTTRPFEEVKDQIYKTITKEAVDKLLKEVQTTVAQKLTADYETWKGAHPTTAASQPTGYPSFEYMQAVSADVQKQYGVRLVVVDNPKSEKPGADVWIPVSELFELKGIGDATAPGEFGIQDLVSRSSPLNPPATGATTKADALNPWQFSPPLTSSDAVYFFRITDAQQAHAPTDVAEVKSAVESDLRLSRAYAKALEQADALIAAAKTQGLASAASASRQKVITTGYFDESFRGGFNGREFTQGQPIPGYAWASEIVKAQLLSEASTLLSKANPNDQHPLTIIKIPDEKKVVVAELAGLQNQFVGAEGAARRLILTQRLEIQGAMAIKSQWFGYEALSARLNWKPKDAAMTRPSGEAF